MSCVAIGDYLAFEVQTLPPAPAPLPLSVASSVGFRSSQTERSGALRCIVAAPDQNTWGQRLALPALNGPNGVCNSDLYRG